MKSMSETKKKLLMSGAMASLAFLGMSAYAQHTQQGEVAAVADTAPTGTVEDEMLGEPVKGGLAPMLEGLLTDDFFEDEFGGEFSAGALMSVRHAYAQRLFEPVWTERGANSLADTSRSLIDHGLLANGDDLTELDSIISTRFDSRLASDRAKADLRLTATWLRLASAVSGGLSDEGEAANPGKTDERPARLELSQSLEQAGRGNIRESLDELEPEHPQYIGLKNMLNEYREIRSAGGWLAIPEGDIVEAGDADERVPALRQRLAAEGFYTGPVSGEVPTQEDLVFDDKTVSALKNFQARHGLEQDGVIGPNTIAALNESVESKIDRILDSMNRWRHLGDPGEHYIWANIPSFTAEAWSDGTRDLQMKTIVGMPSRQTVTFSDEVEYVVANPKWYAPVSIVRRDKLPKLANDPSYATRGNYSVYNRETGEQVHPASVNWNDPSSAERYRLVQNPGPGNALGELKIIFPNQYSIYLHGTPSKELFEEANRAFSSGCIRLEDPIAMARWLARYDGTVDPSEISQEVAEGDLEKIEFSVRTPVHITYMTVTVDDDGQINFWRDIYDRTEGIDYVNRYVDIQTATLSDELETRGDESL